MDCPRISVIVPVYKVEKYLDKCVNSILNQSYSNLEVILVDDGSPDRCPQMCDEYKNADSRVLVIHKENGGLSSSRNVGLDAASGELIAFVDSDDWIDQNTFREMLAVKRTTGADIVCCDGVHTDGEKFYDRCFHCKPTGTVLSGKKVTAQILLDEIGSQVVKGLYEKKCWDDIRFPIGRLYEDIPVTFLAFERAEKVAYIDEPFYKYRINMKSISGTPNVVKSYYIFWGFKDHYEYAANYYPEIATRCCSNAAHYAISTYMHYCTDGKEQLAPYASIVCDFLNVHKHDIDLKLIMRSRRYALKLYYFSDRMFKLFCLIFYKSGIQKALHFDIK
jgi:glycosyltransferase involved in cell wall biosynthesis